MALSQLFVSLINYKRRYATARRLHQPSPYLGPCCEGHDSSKASFWVSGRCLLVLFVEPPAPSSIMPAQKLEKPLKKRPAAAPHRLQQPATKTMSGRSWDFCELHLLVSSFSQVECISKHLCMPTFSKLTLQYRIRRLGVLLQQFVLFHWISSFLT